MAEAYKVLSQTSPIAASLTDSYTVPGATSAVLSSLIVCNRGANSTRFRVSIAIAGAADAVAQYIFRDVVLPPNETFMATLGITLAATDVVRVYAEDATLSFSLYGAEIT